MQAEINADGFKEAIKRRKVLQLSCLSSLTWIDTSWKPEVSCKAAVMLIFSSNLHKADQASDECISVSHVGVSFTLGKV